MKVALRAYQQTALDAVRAAYAQGKRAPLLCSPTGSGKTVIFAAITEGAARKGKRVLILVHRRELLTQCSRALDELGEPHGLISPHYKQTNDAVQVASVQSLARRNILAPDLIVIDEAHHSVAGSYQKTLQRWSSAKRLGVTATAGRTDGRGLGDVFDSLILGPSVAQLIKDGYLSRPIVYAPPNTLDIAHIRHRAGEFDAAASAALLDRASICGDVISHYKKLCDGKPAIAFCATVAHAHHVAEQFAAAGLKVAVLDGQTEDALRRGMIRDLGSGALNVLTSCDVVSEGLDVPRVFAAILLRPTESTGLFLQQCGRVLRPYPGKPHALILDHVGNCLRHDMPDADREWTLDGSKQGKAKGDGDAVQRMKMCHGCYAMNHLWRSNCEQCGHVFEPQRELPKQVEGELVEVTEAQKRALRWKAKSEVSGARTREALQAIAQSRGYKSGWVDFMLRARAKNKYGGPVAGHITIREMKGEAA